MFFIQSNLQKYIFFPLAAGQDILHNIFFIWGTSVGFPPNITHIWDKTTFVQKGRFMKCSRIIPLPPVFDERVPQTWNIWVIANLKVDDLCQNFFIIQDAWKNWTVYYSTKSFYERDQLELDRPNQDSSLLLYVSVNTWIAISVVISIIGRFMWSFFRKEGSRLGLKY